ncbi:MAG: phage replisome organizer N-terminal domain-containing protein [Firmicutes bacterium]|jgi:predicted phage replisome organizer|nr:phage replisome organizer N-terminal domain-containing protein [Bacillota bacterium]CDE07942.1 dnaD and phage-associated domain [Bacillus sp. CAG:988]
MSNNRFYWIKLKTNFFNREDIDFLLSQKNGAEYVVLYQMLCLNTANNNGRLETKMGEIIIPYNADKIVRDCKYFDIDTVNVAMSLYKRLGLIYEEEQDGVLKIADYEDMVGSESKWAEKKRLYRENQKKLECSYNKDNVGDIKEDNVRQEYRDKSIEYRDIDIRDINNSVSVSKAELLDFFERFEINSEDNQSTIIKYLNDGMSFEVIKNGLMIPYDRNVMNFDFDEETAPINNPIGYGLQILENWHNMGVKTLEEAKKYNKLNKNRSEMIVVDKKGGTL